MKAIKLLPFLLLILASSTLFAQTSTKVAALVGAWVERTDSMQEIKLISPTHTFFLVNSLVNDTLFGAGAGTYSVSGNKYTENLEYATFDIKMIKESTYNYTVTNNTLKTQGNLVLTNGHQIPLKHTFTRIEGGTQNSGKQIGTWNQLSSTFLGDNGAKASHTNATHIRYQIITPTHWMRISLANGKFENAFGGTYTIKGNKQIIKVEFASDPSLIGDTAELTQTFQGNKMTISGPVKDAQGKQINNITDVFERVSD